MERGVHAPLFLAKTRIHRMITEAHIKELLEEHFRDSDKFVVDVRISDDNRIQVEIDSMDSISVEECGELNRWLRNSLEQNGEDFELSVSSPGLSNPFRVREQYIKNKGREVKVMTTNNKRVKGVIRHVGENEFEIEQAPSKKKAQKGTGPTSVTIGFDEVKETKAVIAFK